MSLKSETKPSDTTRGESDRNRFRAASIGGIMHRRRYTAGVPLKRERAFILSAIPLREKDRIVTFLTEHSGKKRGVARGARRLQSAYAGSLEPMSQGEILYFEKEGRDLHRIDSIEIERSSFPLASDLGAGLLLSAIAESLITFVADSDP